MSTTTESTDPAQGSGAPGVAHLHVTRINTAPRRRAEQLLNIALFGRINPIERHYEQGRSGTSQRTNKPMRCCRPIGISMLFVAMIVPPGYSQALASWRDPSPHAVRFVTVEKGVQLEEHRNAN